jgi:ribonucleoside-triphosphate reductase (formate)
MYNRCVDSQTEALTPNGWRKHDELQIGEPIWAYSIENDICKWESLQDIFVNHEYHENLHVLESQNISARFTDGHRWAVVHEKDKTQRYEVSALQERHYVVLSRPPIDLGNRDQQDLFELLGWVITDGTYHKERNSGFVYQALHNPKVTKLRRCLEANEITSEPEHVDQNNVGRWRIPAQNGKQLRRIAPTKEISSIRLDEHSGGNLSSLLDGVIAGDGYTRVQRTMYECREIYTTKEKEASAIQALCTVTGATTNSRLIENSDAFCPTEYAIYLKKTAWAYMRPAIKEPEYYEGTVWCPTVASGFWLARRSGKTYVTGNSHPSGRKINTPEQRQANGASYYR